MTSGHCINKSGLVQVSAGIHANVTLKKRKKKKERSHDNIRENQCCGQQLS